MTETEDKAGHTCGGHDCLCHGAGPMFSEFLRRIGPPDDARRHFEAARLEILKGLRAVIDARIGDLDAHQSKGTKLNVE